MTASTLRVEVNVQWDTGNFTTATLISEPTRQLSYINVNLLTTESNSQPLDENGKIFFRAEGFDTNSKKIPDLLFKWEVVPSDGNGEVLFFPEPSPLTSGGQDASLASPGSDPILDHTMGDKSVFIHRIKKFEWTPTSPQWTYIYAPGGSCKVRVNAQSGGVMKSSDTGNINLLSSNPAP